MPSTQANSGVQAPSERYLDAAGVMEKLAISRSSLYRLVQAGTLPQPIYLGMGRRSLRRWRERDLDAAIENAGARHAA